MSVVSFPPLLLGLVVVEAKRQDINGQCTKKDGACKGKEVRDSIYNDLKVSMYLLGNAFRINQTKAPDNLPTVQAAKAFFKEMVRRRISMVLLLQNFPIPFVLNKIVSWSCNVSVY
jgi:hypothetical protein